MPNVLGTAQLDFAKMSDMDKAHEIRHGYFVAPESEDLHPQIKTIRKRTREFMHELDELGKLKPEK